MYVVYGKEKKKGQMVISLSQWQFNLLADLANNLFRSLKISRQFNIQQLEVIQTTRAVLAFQDSKTI